MSYFRIRVCIAHICMGWRILSIVVRRSVAFIMRVGFNFIVIKYETSAGRDVLEGMTRLGFNCINISHNDEVSFWRQGNCLIQLQSSDKREIAGIGLLVDDVTDAIGLGATKDLRTGWYKLLDPSGLEVYLIQDDELDDTFNNSYNMIPQAGLPNADKGLAKFSGIVLNHTATDEIKDFYKSLGFKQSETGSMSKFLTDNNFFTMLIGEIDSAQKAVVYADSDDIFKTLRGLAIADTKMIPGARKDKIGYGLDYKVSAYDAASFGNEKSYSIEKIIPNALPLTDIIVRERVKKLHISEEIVKSHYNTDK